MTLAQYNLVLSEIENYSDPDAFVSDLSLSSIWGDAEDEPIPQERITALAAIWTASHRSVREIASAAGMSMSDLARYFGIPRRTVNAWQNGERGLSPYISLMMQEALGLYHMRRGDEGNPVPVTARLLPGVYKHVSDYASAVGVTASVAVDCMLRSHVSEVDSRTK